MDFGLLPPDEFPLVDFTLPLDSALTTRVLADAHASVTPEVYVGCAKWGRKEWVGMIYPEKTKEARFLDEYAKHFNSIELNAVFYGMPKKEQVRTWKEKALAVRPDFKFCPKFTQAITHIRRLKNAQEETEKYLEGILEFGEFLGPCFMQLSDNFGPKNMEILEAYVADLPADLRVFVEVRHKDWFADPGARKALFEMLHQYRKGAAITDASGRRDCVHMELPTPDAFIRFVGNGLHPTDFTRIDAWVERLAQWSKEGLRSIWFFLHQHDEKDTPVLADYAVRKINEALGTQLQPPTFLHR